MSDARWKGTARAGTDPAGPSADAVGADPGPVGPVPEEAVPGVGPGVGGDLPFSAGVDAGPSGFEAVPPEVAPVTMPVAPPAAPVPSLQADTASVETGAEPVRATTSAEAAAVTEVDASRPAGDPVAPGEPEPILPAGLPTLDAADVDAALAPPAAPVRRGFAPAGRMWRALGPARTAWLVALLAMVLALVSIVQWRQLEARDGTRRQVAEAAGRALNALTNWQSADLSAVRGEVDRFATDRFRGEAQQVLDGFEQGLAQVQAKSTGQVLDLVADISSPDRSAETNGQTAVAFALVRQEISSTEYQAPQVTCWPSRTMLKRVNGAWLVDDIEVYRGNACPEEQ